MDDNEKPVDLLEHRTGLDRVDIIGRLTLEAVLEAGEEKHKLEEENNALRAANNAWWTERQRLLEELAQAKRELESTHAALVRRHADLELLKERLDRVKEQRNKMLSELTLERDKLRAANVRLEHDLTVARALLDKELERPSSYGGHTESQETTFARREPDRQARLVARGEAEPD